MGRKTNRSAVIDGVLKLVVVGGVTTTVLLAPNAVQMFDKPLRKFFNKMDRRARERLRDRHDQRRPLRSPHGRTRHHHRDGD